MYTSYPKITKQGANLTIEVILRAVQEAFERRNAQCIEGVKITCFKRIYIQVDSTPANKCYVVLLALAALLLMGVTDKVRQHLLYTFASNNVAYVIRSLWRISFLVTHTQMLTGSSGM